ncbi:integral membrane protein, YjbE family [Seinonella peptonophila]|uniref:Integral membrane protein, YjbE family n=1 Tax=Seinonella peptonophila TaxID=112248 RepID=A0A1M4V4W9_9BACL|nr:TerC family protein [Seinonella peptonophila]SHE64024.1 integral membrane protein, YjbE family [Seinonella peptonophila]
MELMWTDIDFWLSIVYIIILDLVLSGDNAVVIGMAARNLPMKQRKKAIMIGAGLAVILRAALTAVAAYLLNIPLIMTIGGGLLLWIAVKLLVEEEPESSIAVGSNMRTAIKTIIIADLVMSLDNVVAVAGTAHGNIVLVVFGLAFSIPIIMWGSKWVANLLNRFTWLTYVGSAILGYTAGKLIIDDPVIDRMIADQNPVNQALPIILAILVVLVGYLWKKKIEMDGKTI